jgi:carbon monoxide dehydrogenase subunit G
MPTFTVTRSIEIDAPVGQVFRFISDPCRRMSAMARVYERREAVSDVEASPDGVVTRYKVTTRFFWLPFSTTIPMIRAEHVANERIVEKALVFTKDVDDFTLEASGNGTRLTWRYELTTPRALVKILGLLSAKGKTSQERQMDDNLARFKMELESAPKPA